MFEAMWAMLVLLLGLLGTISLFSGQLIAGLLALFTFDNDHDDQSPDSF